jgi:hypothetical protein
MQVLEISPQSRQAWTWFAECKLDQANETFARIVLAEPITLVNTSAHSHHGFHLSLVSNSL